jgi:hypothetical protein
MGQLVRLQERPEPYMKVRLYIATLALTFVGYAQQTDGVHFSGIAINTTDPAKPMATQIELSLGNTRCALTVLPPLGGSGACHLITYEKASGKIVVVSNGPPVITWNGTVKGNLFSGTYSIDSMHQNGSFYLAIVEQAAVESKPPTPPPVRVPTIPRSSCSPAIEASISGEFHGWSGDTIFKLDNGRIWQQAEYHYDYDYEYNPDVTIYQTTAGCRMKVDGEDGTIIVKRIK